MSDTKRISLLRRGLAAAAGVASGVLLGGLIFAAGPDEIPKLAPAIVTYKPQPISTQTVRKSSPLDAKARDFAQVDFQTMLAEYRGSGNYLPIDASEWKFKAFKKAYAASEYLKLEDRYLDFFKAVPVSPEVKGLVLNCLLSLSLGPSELVAAINEPGANEGELRGRYENDRQEIENILGDALGSDGYVQLRQFRNELPYRADLALIEHALSGHDALPQIARAEILRQAGLQWEGTGLAAQNQSNDSSAESARAYFDSLAEANRKIENSVHTILTPKQIRVLSEVHDLQRRKLMNAWAIATQRQIDKEAQLGN